MGQNKKAPFVPADGQPPWKQYDWTSICSCSQCLESSKLEPISHHNPPKQGEWERERSWCEASFILILAFILYLSSWCSSCLTGAPISRLKLLFSSHSVVSGFALEADSGFAIEKLELQVEGLICYSFWSYFILGTSKKLNLSEVHMLLGHLGAWLHHGRVRFWTPKSAL